jgi:hypothetical protein
VSTDCTIQESIMSLKSLLHGAMVAIPEPGAALNVGEEKSNRA